MKYPHIFKRNLEREFRDSGLSRQQAKTAVSVVWAWVQRGELRLGGVFRQIVERWA